MASERKVLSITPAQDWFEVFRESDGSLFFERVAVWALVEVVDDALRPPIKYQDVVPVTASAMEPGGEIGERVSNSIAVVHASDFEIIGEKLRPAAEAHLTQRA